MPVVVVTAGAQVDAETLGNRTFGTAPSDSAQWKSAALVAFHHVVHDLARLEDT